MNKLSIAIPVMGKGIKLKEITEVCLDSLHLYTPEYKLIVVSNGSDEENLKYLEKTLDYRKDKLIVYPEAIGYPKAVNIGLQEIGDCEFVVIANNDLVFTPGWAEKMIQHFRTDEKLGVLGTTTNMVEGYQHMGHNKPGVDFQYTDVLTFFCVMIRKEVLDEVGLLDEQFSPGGQEDADFCIRTRKAGWKIGIARDVFLYHYGSGTFRELMDAPQSREYAKSRVKLLRDKYRDVVDPAVKKRVFIAIPNLGCIAPGLSTNLLHWSHDPRYQITTYKPEGIFPLDAARNRCVKEFLERDDDYLFWVDADIVPPVGALHRLVQADKDAVGAVCFSMKADQGKYFPYPVTLRYNKDKEYTVYYGQGIEEVDATGGACVLFKRKVFETIERPYEFLYYPDGTLRLTCDFYIFQKMQKAGFKLFIDFDILCDHQKKCSLKGIQDLLSTLQKG